MAVACPDIVASVGGKREEEREKFNQWTLPKEKQLPKGGKRAIGKVPSAWV